MRATILFVVVTLALLPAGVSSGGKAKDDGFVSLFSGKDLTGWVNVNCAPETFFVRDGIIVTTGTPTGFLRTERHYENFIAEFEWMHVPPKKDAVGNSGFFVWADPLPAVGTPFTRGIEVQVLVNLEKKDFYTSHGDIFSIWGATCEPDRPHPKGWARCLPSEMRAKGAGEWNHYRVVANDGTIKLSVNGKEVSGVTKCNPRKGYLALEAEGSECRFRNIKIKELPSTKPTPKETADVAKPFKNLFTGLDLRGWKATDEHKKHWKPRDWVLTHDGKSRDDLLATEREYRDFELIVDWRLAAKPKVDATPSEYSRVLLRGGELSIAPSTGSMVARFGGKHTPPKVKVEWKPGTWNRFRVRMKGSAVTVYLNNQLLFDNEEVSWVKAPRSLGLLNQGHAVEFANLFVRELGKDE